MKTQIQGLFLALLLVFAAIPAFALTDEESDQRQTEQIAIEASKGKEPLTFWLYPGDQKKLESNMYLTYNGPAKKAKPMACTEELKLCSDGKTYVGRDSNNGCAFNACPGEPAVSVSFAPDQSACEQFSMTFSTPAVLNKPLVNSNIKQDARYEEKYMKLKQEFEKKYNKYVAEGDEEKAVKAKEEFIQAVEKLARVSDDEEFDDDSNDDSDADRSDDDSTKPIQGSEGAPPTMRSETKTFCILPGEVGYPIILYEKKEKGVLVGYTAWKGENPSSYVAMSGETQALRQKDSSKNEGSCKVEGNGLVPIGTRLNVEGKSQYCDALTKKMMTQKQDAEQAENDYECLSNEARNGQCVNSLSFLQKIWKSITGIFGF